MAQRFIVNKYHTILQSVISLSLARMIAIDIVDIMLSKRMLAWILWLSLIKEEDGSSLQMGIVSMSISTDKPLLVFLWEA